MKKKIVVTKKSRIDLDSLVAEYKQLSIQESFIKKRKTELAEQIKEESKKIGKVDSKGSFICRNSSFEFGARCKRSIYLNHGKAKSLLIKKKLWEDIAEVATKNVIDPGIVENEIAKLFESGLITYKELESIKEIDESFSVFVDEIKDKSDEEMPEVDVLVNSPKSSKPTLAKKR